LKRTQCVVLEEDIGQNFAGFENEHSNIVQFGEVCFADIGASELAENNSVDTAGEVRTSVGLWKPVVSLRVVRVSVKRSVVETFVA